MHIQPPLAIWSKNRPYLKDVPHRGGPGTPSMLRVWAAMFGPLSWQCPASPASGLAALLTPEPLGCALPALSGAGAPGVQGARPHRPGPEAGGGPRPRRGSRTRCSDTRPSLYGPVTQAAWATGGGSVWTGFPEDAARGHRRSRPRWARSWCGWGADPGVPSALVLGSPRRPPIPLADR